MVCKRGASGNRAKFSGIAGIRRQPAGNEKERLSRSHFAISGRLTGIPLRAGGKCPGACHRAEKVVCPAVMQAHSRLSRIDGPAADRIGDGCAVFSGFVAFVVDIHNG